MKGVVLEHYTFRRGPFRGAIRRWNYPVEAGCACSLSLANGADVADMRSGVSGRHAYPFTAGEAGFEPATIRRFWRPLPSPMSCSPADGAGFEPADPLSGAGELATHNHKPLGHPSEESIARAGAVGRVIGPSYVPTLNPEHAQEKCSPCVPMGGCVNFASNRPQPTTPIKEGHARTSNPNSQENGRIA
jgi:hypothetical protein